MSFVPPGSPPPSVARPLRVRLFLLAVGVVGLALAVFVFAQIFTGCLIPFPTDMKDQPSVGYVEPPRKEPPADAVPFGEAAQLAGLGATANPVSFSPESQNRGRSLYALFCQLCHGEPQAGEPGGVGALFQPPPPDLSASAGRLSDEQMFQIITNGVGRMPALAPNLSPLERWDTVNFLRSFSPAEAPAEFPVQHAARNYGAQCAQCHGAAAEGALGPPLFPSSFLTEGTIEEVTQFIRVGRRQRGMPPFGGRMSEDEITQLSDLLKRVQSEGPEVLQAALEEGGPATTTTAPPAATTTTTAPAAGTTTTVATDQALLEQGERVFAANCESCHGQAGEGGGIGPELNPSDFVAGSPDPAVRGVVENGRPGTAMPPFRDRLSEEDITAVVALLRSWSPGGPQGMTDVALAQEEEELPFSHQKHVDRGMQCQFCHSGARRSPAADLPALELCAACHRVISTQNENTQRVVAAADEGRRVSWPRVYDQPDFVYFSHRPHVAVAGLGCGTCHGDVGSMGLARRVSDLDMGFCLDCHQQRDYPGYIEADEEGGEFGGGLIEGEFPTGKFLTDCHICHK